MLEKIKSRFLEGRPISYEESKELAAHHDQSVRERLAQSHNVRKEILYFLADDEEPSVRQLIARNEATPRPADALLVHDEDAGVRTCLAEKISRLAPSLSAEERADVRELTLDILEELAKDQIPRVRQILSEALKDYADAPPSIINRLARDTELLVSAPVLEFSPVLSDADLIEIIKDGTGTGQLTAISSRSEVREPVSDAIFDTRDRKAITTLLANDSAQIREETLDGIINEAKPVTEWHEPLVHRPLLTSGAAIRLAEYVADNMLRVLGQRKELDEKALSAVQAEVGRRLAQSANNEDIPSPATGPKVEQDAKAVKSAAPKPAKKPGKAKKSKKTRNAEISMGDIKKLHASGKLKAGDLVRALDDGDRRFVKMALAVRSELPIRMVEDIVGSRDPRAVIALLWKANLQATIIDDMQAKLAKIAKRDMIHPEGGKDFPMTDDDMAWQLEMYL
ncbi:MAG: DUF2336 domain-containing protein [Rhodospirillales bacterium]|nr:DUF2336 domain-containing protein [Rhodospirillales bacterium]